MESVAASAAPSVPPLSAATTDERARRYQAELAANRQRQEQRQKENNFLRSSLRASKRLKQLVETRPTDQPQKVGENGIAASYANASFENHRISTGDDDNNVENDGSASTVKLNGGSEPIQAIDRLADQLERSAGAGEAAAFRAYFRPPKMITSAATAAESAPTRYPMKPQQQQQETKERCTQLGTEHGVVRHANGNEDEEGEEEEEDEEEEDQRPSCSSSSAASKAATNGQSGLTDNHANSGPNVKIVALYKAEDSYLGATVRNDGDRVIIGRVVRGGLVERANLFHEGDQLLEVNGVDLRGKSVQQVCDMLRCLSGEVTLIVAPKEQHDQDLSSENLNGTGPRADDSQFGDDDKTAVVHMRALFDYDPDSDIYVPCRELALRFSRGDVLHVINRTDPDWWQAYRDGDDASHALAGLVPSDSFRRRVLLYNREVEKMSAVSATPERSRSGTSERGGGKKSARGRSASSGGTLKRLRKKKERRPSAETNTSDSILLQENSVAELRPYEEVALHLSRVDRRRPLVLVGPEGAGCLDVRRRLLEADALPPPDSASTLAANRLASPVPHTTRAPKPGEQNAVHYYFVSKQHFQSLAAAGEFVEWGEWQNELYGTSRAAIRAVVDRAKTGVLTLKAESLASIRNSTFMPFVVFIAPPALQQLKRQRETAGLPPIKDEQLRAIVDEGRRIDQEFGHLFDAVIINGCVERAVRELRRVLHLLDTQPHWVPADWTVKSAAAPSQSDRRSTQTQQQSREFGERAL